MRLFYIIYCLTICVMVTSSNFNHSKDPNYRSWGTFSPRSGFIGGGWHK